MEYPTVRPNRYVLERSAYKTWHIWGYDDGRRLNLEYEVASKAKASAVLEYLEWRKKYKGD